MGFKRRKKPDKETAEEKKTTEGGDDEKVEKRSLSRLRNRNILVFDLEIKVPIEECSNGWGSHDEMGISVLCSFDYRDMSYGIYMDDNMQEFVDRANEPGTLLVGFNIVNFDYKVVAASGYDLKPKEDLLFYDLFKVSTNGAPKGRKKGGFKLDDHLEALNLPRKTASGELAPMWWKNGQIGRLIMYCLQDTRSERALFEWFWTMGTSANKKNPDPFTVEPPVFT